MTNEIDHGIWRKIFNNLHVICLPYIFPIPIEKILNRKNKIYNNRGDSPLGFIHIYNKKKYFIYCIYFS